MLAQQSLPRCLIMGFQEFGTRREDSAQIPGYAEAVIGVLIEGADTARTATHNVTEICSDHCFESGNSFASQLLELGIALVTEIKGRVCRPGLVRKQRVICLPVNLFLLRAQRFWSRTGRGARIRPGSSGLRSISPPKHTESRGDLLSCTRRAQVSAQVRASTQRTRARVRSAAFDVPRVKDHQRVRAELDLLRDWNTPDVSSSSAAFAFHSCTGISRG